MSPMRLTLVGAQDAAAPLAHPRDMVTIVQGTGYTVPANKIFVLTALGTISITTSTVVPVSFIADGSVEIRAGLYGAGSAAVQAGSEFHSNFASVVDVPEGITFTEGQILQVDIGGGGTNGRAYGYICDE